MTFESFTTSHCTEVQEAQNGERADIVAQAFLRLSGGVNDDATRRRLIDGMRGTRYFDKGYAGNCLLKLRPYPI